MLSDAIYYAAILYAGMFFASFPYGFIKGFRESIGKPLAEAAVTNLHKAELLTEACVIVGFITVRTANQGTEAVGEIILSYLLAKLFGSILSFALIDVSASKETMRAAIEIFAYIPSGVIAGVWLGNILDHY